MDKTIGRSLGNESLEENSCILEVPYIRAGGEPDQKTTLVTVQRVSSRKF